MARHHTIKEVEAALRANSGQPVLAAAALGISRQAVHDRINRSPALQAVMEEIDARLLSKSMDNVTKAIEAGDLQVSRWLLERKGRHLGFGTKAETAVDEARIERLVEAIAVGGIPAIRAVIAALEGS